MKIGVIGANGQVGVELTLLLQAAGHNPVPIVRSQLSSAFLRDQGLDCRIGDITEEEPSALLQGLDAVVVAAHVHPYQDGRSPREARRLNEAIVEGAATGAPAHAPLIYFSSISAFGDEIGAPSRPIYAAEKRNAESTLKSAANQPWYALRLGHVIGPNQDYVSDLRTVSNQTDQLRVRGEGSTPSNTVHTATLAASVLTCTEDRPAPGTYTVVNRPQWTWREVFERYCPDTEVTFTGTGEDSSSVVESLQRFGVNAVERHVAKIEPWLVRVPDSLFSYLVARYRRRRTADTFVSLLNDRQPPVYDDPILCMDATPGPNLPDVGTTEEHLESIGMVCEAFKETPLE